IILGGLPLYLLIRRPWKRRSGREWGLGAFVLFMCALLILTLEGEYGAPASMVKAAAERIATGEKINLTPFANICYFFVHFKWEDFLINIVGNIVMFIPWGFGLVYLWPKNRRIWIVAMYSLALPVFIESCQLFIGRNVDVDDLILNFTGGCLGAGIYRLLKR
ncbi:MAG: VanZ family protein, partial [Acetatifactor sp.]|nr:VanZ family protein [Acetatifactor sp.]